MANKVFANGREVSCKKANGKAICAFPDVCFTPPQTPATPPGVPIPYPNTGMASDTTSGSKKVKISDKEVMLKNKSHFKTSIGDEAGCAPKKGIITSKTKGKVYFNAWSMDVKFEGKNVVRSLDLTTHNHASQPGQTPPWVYMDAMTMSTASDDCKAETQKTQDCMEKHIKNNTKQQPRKDHKVDGATKKAAVEDNDKVDWDAMVEADAGKKEFYNKAGATRDMCEDDECKGQLDCNLVPFDFGCCDGKTPHHVIPAHCFMPSGERKAGSGERYPGCDKYDDTTAPCICLEGGTKSESDAAGKLKEHGRVHAIVDVEEDKFMKVEELSTPTGKPMMRGGERATKKTAGSWSFEDANEKGSDAVTQVKQTCNKACMKKQCEAAHKEMGLDVGPGKSDKLMLRADSSGNRTPAGFVPGGAVTSAPGV
ncbi:MAG: PAAR-like domain-containing protein [Candidatus Thiodiazotropha sp.]